MSRRYLLISPCRDEAEYLQRTIDSVAAQTVLPKKWVIVDDGSTDATPQILERAARTWDFIQIVRREDRGKRSVGPGVVDAFYAGQQAVDLQDYDYVCKLDVDLEFGPRYFERLMEHFDADPVLGNRCQHSVILRGRPPADGRIGEAEAAERLAGGQVHQVDRLLRTAA